MIPNLYKLAGRANPLRAPRGGAHRGNPCPVNFRRSLTDVMAVHETGCAMLCASNVQEARDFALISRAASLNSRLPFIHFFDGFRTSHEITKIAPLDDETLRALLPVEVSSPSGTALTPDKPVIRGTASNQEGHLFPVPGRQAPGMTRAITT